MTESEVKELLSQAMGMGLYGLVITGGEPMMRDDLSEIIRFAKSEGLFVAITTNGMLISEKNVNCLLQADLITVSIDSLLEEKHNHRRGVSGFRKAMNGLNLLRNHNVRTYLTVQAVIDEDNWREINDINRYFHARGIDTVFQLIYGKRFSIPQGEWEEKVARLRYHKWLTELLHRNYLRCYPGISSGERIVPCLAANFVVSPYGELLACNYIRKPIADLKKVSLQTAWRNYTRHYISGRGRKCTCGNTCFIPIAMLISR